LKQDEIEILVIDATLGSKKSMESLYKHFLIPMRRFAAIRTGDKMVAEDLVQNVWIKVHKRMRRLKDVSLFRSWLFKALRWEILDWLKHRNQTTNNYSENMDELIASSPIDVTSLLPMMTQLDENERDVVELYYLNDLSLIETAMTLDLPNGTVKSRLFRAREKLRKYSIEGEKNEY
jgi:RNA polymerase sigma-70 factor (ECF subfamily)